MATCCNQSYLTTLQVTDLNINKYNMNEKTTDHIIIDNDQYHKYHVQINSTIWHWSLLAKKELYKQKWVDRETSHTFQ